MRGGTMRLGLTLAAMISVAACGGPGGAQTGVPASVPASASADATVAPIPSDIAYAMHQRQVFGLRADEGWVRAVAANPAATTFTLDIPLTPAEDAWFQSRQADLDTVAQAVKAYGATVPDAYAGVYIDQARGTVVALFTVDAGRHRLRILEALGRSGPLAAREVRYTSRALDDLQERISAGWAWMSAIDAAPGGVGVDVIANRVQLSISSANPAAPGLIAAHYGVPADMLAIDSDGTGVALMARGWIDGRVVTVLGAGPGDNGLFLDWKGDGPGDCGGGDIGYGVGPAGEFRLPCTAGGWTISVKLTQDKVIATGHVVVKANADVKLRITLPIGAPLN